MELTLKNFMSNPMGDISKGDTKALSLRLNQEYFSLMKSAGKKLFRVQSYRDRDTFFHYFKIPSTEYWKNGLYYDVIIRFFPKTNKGNADYTMSNYNIQVFSNSPSFLFRYAYVYNSKNLLIPWTRSLIGSKAINNPPVKTNSKQEIGFEKSIYFACLYLMNNPNMMMKSMSKIKRLDQSRLKKELSSCEKKLTEYNKCKSLLKGKKNKAKQQSLKKVEKKVNSTEFTDIVPKKMQKQNVFTTKGSSIKKPKSAFKRATKKKKSVFR